MQSKWSEWRDSNPRPLVPQTSALTGLRYTPTLAFIEKALFGRNAVRKIADGSSRRAIGAAPRPKCLRIQQVLSGPRATAQYLRRSSQTPRPYLFGLRMPRRLDLQKLLV
jgi:hypothetical protein